MLLSIFPFFWLTPAEKIHFVQEIIPNNPPLSIQFFTVLTQLSGFVYAGLIIRMVNRHQQKIGSYFSYTQQVNLNWLKYLAWGLIGLWAVVFTMNFLYLALGWEAAKDMDFIIFGTVTLFIFYLGWNGLRQGILFPKSSESPAPLPKSEASEPVRYAKSGLSDTRAQRERQRLVDFMEREKPYLQSKLTLGELAESLALPPNHLSQVINSQFGQNFYEFVNHYRIEAFKARLQDPRNRQYTLLANAMEAGFQSKSSFNEVFKKMTGHTPSQYLRSLDAETE
ncbi:MAG: AraC family transcriptional regulator, partial [Bacteroidota bacterium]